jgi:hypothetical protein
VCTVSSHNEGNGHEHACHWLQDITRRYRHSGTLVSHLVAHIYLFATSFSLLQIGIVLNSVRKQSVFGTQQKIQGCEI